MGQAQSLADSLPDVDSVHMQVVRHTKVLSEINSLTYEEFKTCLGNLNALSRKCIDPNGKQLVFLVKNGTDTSLLWKATVKIACHSESENESVRSDPHSFVNHYANVNDSLRQSWKKTKPVRNYSSYTDSEPEGSAVMSLNGGQIIVNNMARSRAPLPGFSSFV